MDQTSRARAAMGGAPLSLEASLDEENREVLAGLERQRSHEPRTTPADQGLTSSPPVRSMLDVDDSRPRHGSIAGIGVGITSPRDQRKPSRRLNPADPSTWTKPHQPVSPASARSSIDATPLGLPKIQLDEKPGFEQNYNFDMASMPTNPGGTRSPEARKASGAMAAALGGNTANISIYASDDRAGAGEGKVHRSDSLSNKITQPVPFAPPSPQRAALSPSSAVSDHQRRFSDKSSSFSDMSEEPTGRVDMDNEGEENALAESSEEDQYLSSDGESPVDTRGRRRDKSPIPAKDEIEKKQENDNLAPQSKGVRSLLEPMLSPSLPHDRKPEVHPGSSFGRSGPTQADFEDEDEMQAEIEKAKSLGLSISAVDDSIPDRHVRMIIRGDWAKMQADAEEGNHTSRLYFACSDLSTEASYALEWTVGTMLRDGDTLLAIYAIEDESAPKESEGNAVVMAESAKAAHDTSDTMAKLTRQATDLSGKTARPLSKFIPATEAPTLTGSVDARNVSKKEMERLKAMDEITANFLKLVRKTPLQVRCMVEVIHVKSPKHLILNAIDELEPTLCVVGTRGRSSLKGVLLGSFSNYLVTKSSVPVMVARRRLKKPRHAKVNSTSIRLTNNLRSTALTRPRRGLENARID